MENLNLIIEIVVVVVGVFSVMITGIFIGRNFYSWDGFFMIVIHRFYLKLMEGSVDKNKTQFEQLNNIRKLHIEQADLMLEKMKKLNYSEKKKSYEIDTNTYIGRKIGKSHM